MCDPFGWHKLEKEKIEEIRTKLGHLESRTWSDILVNAKKLNHTIARDDLSKEAQDRLAELELDDVDSLISLHLSGKERVFGIKTDVALTILWWDPDHTICPSKLKHT